MAFLLIALAAQATTLTLAQTRSVEQTLAQLAPVVGVQLIAAKPLQDLPICLKVDKVEAEALLARIAEVTYGRWEVKSSGRTLLVDEARTREARQAKLAARSALIRKAVEDMTSELRDAGPFDVKGAVSLVHDLEAIDDRTTDDNFDSGAYIKAFNRAPMYRTVIRALRLVPAESIAAIPEGECWTFSNLPKPLEFPIRSSATSDVLKQLMVEQRVWEDARDRVGGRKPESMYNGDPRFFQELGTDEATRIVVAVSNPRNTNPLRVDITVGNSQGQQILWSQRQIPTDLSRNVMKAWFDPDKQPEQVQLSETTLRRLRRQNPRWWEGEPPELTPQDLEKILHPEENDPAAVGNDEVLSAYSKQVGGNLVACLGDDIRVVGPAVIKDGKVAPALFVRSMEYQGYAVGNQGGWLTVRPDIDAPHTPRAALGKMLRALHAQGWLSLDELGTFATSTHPEAAKAIFDREVTQLSRSTASLFTFPNWSVLRFYGSLEPTGRAALLREGTAPLSALGAAAKDAFVATCRYVGFGFMANVIVEPMRTGATSSNLCEELDRGLTDVKLTGAVEKTPLLLLDDLKAMVGPLPPKAVGASSKFPRTHFTDQARYWLGEGTTVMLLMPLPERRRLRLTLAERRFDFKAKPRRIAEMPESIRKAYTQAANETNGLPWANDKTKKPPP